MAAIIANHLTKIYDKKKVAVDNISFQVRKGEIFGFLGPNGAGKSTTISMMTGILRSSSGDLTILGKKLPQELNLVQGSIGYVPQELVFYDHLKVVENLKLFSKAYEVNNAKQRINEVIDLLKLGEFKDQLSRTLSGGQKRRLNVALGMLHSPDILILDEPSAGMDPQSRQVLWNSIKAMAKSNMTIILTTHLMETADAICDRICIIDHGEIKVIDTPNNLKSRYGESSMIELKFVDDIDEIGITNLVEVLNGKFETENIMNYNHTITINTPDGVNIISEIVNLVEQVVGKKSIQNISMRDNTLEDVFIQITGHKLRE